MSEIKKVSAAIMEQNEIAPGIFELLMEVPEVAKNAKPGQFVNLYLDNKSKLLPRPISICDINEEKAGLRLVYRAGREGSGTEEISGYIGILAHGGLMQETVSHIDVMGPLGNGFTMQGEKPLLIGGGIGIPPMLGLCKSFAKQGIRPMVALGYRSGGDAMYLYQEFCEIADVVVSTDDGSFGTKGTVIDAIRAAAFAPDVIYACGPLPMLRGVKALGQEKKVRTYVSMEERMACGIGACLACVCKTTKEDHHSHVNNARVCKEGPVFDAEELEL